MRAAALDGRVQPIENLASYPTGVCSPAAARVGWWNDRYAADCGYSTLTGISGPIGAITSAARMTVTAANPSRTYGFDIVGNPDSATSTAGLPVRPGDWYVVSFWLRPSRSEPISFQRAFYDASHNKIGSSLITALGSPPAGAWTPYSVSFQVPATAVGLAMYCVNTGSVLINGDTFDGTGLMITRGPKLRPYGDGSMPGWKWLGTPGASQSAGYPSGP